MPRIADEPLLLAGCRDARSPSRRLGGGAARGHRPAPGPSRRDLRQAGDRAPGRVIVLAVDDEERVCCIRQYRHAGGAVFVELPAGICDATGEDPQVTAARELQEEVELQAEHWRLAAHAVSNGRDQQRAAPHLPCPRPFPLRSRRLRAACRGGRARGPLGCLRRPVGRRTAAAGARRSARRSRPGVRGASSARRALNRAPTARDQAPTALPETSSQAHERIEEQFGPAGYVTVGDACSSACA